jgi:hypothetical protein
MVHQFVPECLHFYIELNGYIAGAENTCFFGFQNTWGDSEQLPNQVESGNTNAGRLCGIYR